MKDYFETYETDFDFEHYDAETVLNGRFRIIKPIMDREAEEMQLALSYGG